MRIVIIDNYDSFTYNLVHYIESLGHDVEVMLNDQINYSCIENSEAILLAPGPGLPEQSGELMNIIKRYYHTHPFLGVCMGMQALAQHDQMKIYNLKNVQHGIPTEIIVSKNDFLFQSMENVQNVGLYHSWAVEAVFSPWQVTAKTKGGVIMAMEHREYMHAAVQFHPESIMTPQGLLMLKNWLQKVAAFLILKNQKN